MSELITRGFKMQKDEEFSIVETGLYEKNIDTLFAFVHSDGNKEGLVGADYLLKNHNGPLLYSNAEKKFVHALKIVMQELKKATNQEIKIVTFKKVSEEIL